MDKADITQEMCCPPAPSDPEHQEKKTRDVPNKGLVIATLGKACKKPEIMIQMIDAGMNVVRLRLCQGERK